MDEVAQEPPSIVNEAQDEDTHGDFDKAGANNESYAFHKGPFEELGQLRRRQGVDMPTGAIRNLVDVGDRAQKR